MGFHGEGADVHGGGLGFGDGSAVGKYECGVAAIGVQFGKPVAQEFIGVHAVIGKENIFLHGFHGKAGVVFDAFAGNVEPLGGEVEEGFFRPMEGVPVAVDDGVVDVVKRGAGDFGGAFGTDRAGKPVDKFGRDAHAGVTDGNGAVIVAREPFELFDEVGFHERGFTQAGGVGSGFLDVAKGFGAVDGMPAVNINYKFWVGYLRVFMGFVYGGACNGCHGVIVSLELFDGCRRCQPAHGIVLLPCFL